MSTASDLAVSAIARAIEDDPGCVVKLHAAVVLHGKDHLEKSFYTSEPFASWRETQRAIGRVEELVWMTDRLKGIVSRFIECDELELATEFRKFGDKLIEKAKKLGAKED